MLLVPARTSVPAPAFVIAMPVLLVRLPRVSALLTTVMVELVVKLIALLPRFRLMVPMKVELVESHWMLPELERVRAPELVLSMVELLAMVNVPVPRA